MGRLLEVDDIQFADANLIPVWEKVRAGERLTHGEGVAILETDDFAAAGKMADFRQETRLRRQGVLRSQPPHQPHEHLRPEL